ncbi:MAG TPA: hypothetical protein RMH99_15145 [Sandaracinaceae bacterium LLY-WYZ-13_1]|nr:hypothetical protein [Sandaracinaceae bacterium LLY-WYZ-13_1]
MRRALTFGPPIALVLALAAVAGCGGGRYGYSRTYSTWGDEGRYYDREVDLTYEEIRRFPDRHADELLGWFGTVEEIESLDRETGEARLRLQLRPHQERHLCADETEGSCRVTVAQRPIGPFTVLVTLRPEELQEGRERLWTGSLLKVYGHVMDAGDDESGPIIQAEWYRHWPHGFFVTTAARGSMRR